MSGELCEKGTSMRISQAADGATAVAELQRRLPIALHHLSIERI
jgi:hypothetical protein